jgi:hypothetical protein
LFDHDSYPGFFHYGGIITSAFHYRRNNYYIIGGDGNRWQLHGNVMVDWIPRSLACDVPQDPRFIKEWTTHLENIERLKNI